MALTTGQQLTGYFWWSFMHKFKEEIRKAQSRDPDFVRIEGINILDLEGLSASALSQETMDVIQLASKISDFFPEVRVHQNERISIQEEGGWDRGLGLSLFLETRKDFPCFVFAVLLATIPRISCFRYQF